MTGDLTINGTDAYTAWGLSFEDGALSALMTPAPNKELIQNKSRITHGKSVITSNVMVDEREISLPFHIVASSKADFFSKYNSFCNVLASGVLNVSSRYQTGVVYHLIYLSCTQFGEYQRDMAKFVLKVCEPDPTNRS